MPALTVGFNKDTLIIIDHSEVHNSMVELSGRYRPEYSYHNDRLQINMALEHIDDSFIHERGWHELRSASYVQMLSIAFKDDGTISTVSEVEELSDNKETRNVLIRRNIGRIQNLTDEWMFVSVNPRFATDAYTIFSMAGDKDIHERMRMFRESNGNGAYVYRYWTCKMENLVPSIETYAGNNNLEEVMQCWECHEANPGIKVVPITFDELRPLGVADVNHWKIK